MTIEFWCIFSIKLQQGVRGIAPVINQASVVLAFVGSFAASSPASAPDSTSWLALRVHVPILYILALELSLQRHCGAKVSTIWAHGPLRLCLTGYP